jgi:hypothetical protein
VNTALPIVWCKKLLCIGTTLILITHAEWVLAYNKNNYNNGDFVTQGWEQVKKWFGYGVNGAAIVILLGAAWSCFKAIKSQWRDDGDLGGAARTVAISAGLATIGLLLLNYISSNYLN